MKRKHLLMGMAAFVLGTFLVLTVRFVVIPGTIQPVGTGVPAITPQFEGIKTRAKSPTATPQGQSRLIRSMDVYLSPYTSCAAERHVTATPTPSGTPLPTSTPTLQPTQVATVSAATEPDFIVMRVVAEESEACYQVGEVFIELKNLYKLAVGITHAVNGEFAIDRANIANSKIGQIVVDLSQLRSDERSRDGAIRQEFLESNRYPLAKLTDAAAIGLPNRPYKNGETLHFLIKGNLLIRKSTRETTFHATATLTDGMLVASAYADILLTDFDISPPNFFGSLRVNNEMRIVLNLVAHEPK